MRKLFHVGVALLAVFLVGLSPACKKKEDPNKDILGRWQLNQIGIGTTMIDLSSSAKANETLTGMLSYHFPNLPQETLNALLANVSVAIQAIRTINCEVKKDGSFAINTPTYLVTGKWTRKDNAITFLVDPGFLPTDKNTPQTELAQKLLVNTPPTCTLEEGNLIYRFHFAPFLDLMADQLSIPEPNETPEQAQQRIAQLMQVKAFAQVAKLIPLSLLFRRI